MSLRAPATPLSLVPCRDTCAELARLRESVETQNQVEEGLLAALREADRDWHLTFDALDALIVLVDDRGRIVRRNAAARAAEDLLGRSLGDLSTEEPWTTAAALLREGLREPRALQVGDGTGPTYDLWWQPAIAPDRRTMILIRDVSEAAALRALARRNEAMAAVGALVAGVAHEVRNPLFGISATLDAFEARFGAPEQGQYLGVLRQQVDRLTRLMKELLDYGRPPTPKLRDASPVPVFEQAIAAVRPAAAVSGVSVTQHVTSPVAEIRHDPQQLLQVLVNLLENAVQHAPAGSAVELVARADHEGLLLQILDRGPGLPEADLERVFEPFVSRRTGGTGLGLAIVRRAVERMGGEVRLRNRRGGGAEALVRIPAVLP